MKGDSTNQQWFGQTVLQEKQNDPAHFIKLPSPVPGVVYFPLVSQGRAYLGAVTCHDQQRQSERKAYLINSRLSERIEEVLGDARFTETGAMLSRCVDVRFATTQFSDDSYTLALALADKCIRLASQASMVNYPMIYATGLVLKDGHGEIAAICGFQKKLELILQEAPPGSWFIFPQMNLTENDDFAAQLKKLEQNNIHWRGISHLDDIQELWANPASSTLSTNQEPQTTQYHGKKKSPIGRNDRSWRSMAIYSFIALLLIGVIMTAAEILLDGNKPDTANTRQQQSDARLMSLIELAEIRQEQPDNGRLCEQLRDISQTLTPYDLSRWDNIYKSAMQKVDACLEALEQSNARLKLFEQIVQQAGMKPADNATLLNTLLTSFDTSRKLDEAQVELIQSITRSVSDPPEQQITLQYELQLLTLQHRLEQYKKNASRENIHALQTALTQWSTADKALLQQQQPHMIQEIDYYLSKNNEN